MDYKVTRPQTIRNEPYPRFRLPTAGRQLSIINRLLLFTLPLLFACEPQPIPIKVATPPPKLVVTTQFIPDRTLAVILTRTFSPLEWASEQDSTSLAFLEKFLVQDALVTLRYGSTVDTLEMASPGVYTSDRVNQTPYGLYSLFVRDPATGETVTATTQMLPPVRFEEVQPAIVDADDGEATVEVYYRFKDDPAVKNWYLVNFYQRVTLDPKVLTPNTFINGDSNESLAFDLISDERLTDTSFAAIRRLWDVNLGDTIAVSISNVTKDYFEFLKLYQRSGNIVTQISGEPITYPTNVVNGYGYFSTHVPYIRLFDLNQKQ